MGLENGKSMVAANRQNAVIVARQRDNQRSNVGGNKKCSTVLWP
jgi:hypothetical protein